MSYAIYGFDECPFCQKAKALLDEEGIPYTYCAINDPDERRGWMDGLVAQGITAERTFPRVFKLEHPPMDGLDTRVKLIGGYQELELEVLTR